jgi:flagellar basal body-associated protein FliL
LSIIGLRKEEKEKDNSTFFTAGEGSKRIVIILTMIALIVILISVSTAVLPGTNTNSDAFTKCKESALGYEQRGYIFSRQ